MGLSSFYVKNLSPWLRKTSFGERLDIALVAFNANLQFPILIYANSGSKIFTEAEIEELFGDLDKESIDVAKRFISRQYRCDSRCLMLHPKYFYTQSEQSEYKKIRADYRKAIRRYHFPMHRVGPESLYYHHGLRFAPDFVKKNIFGKLFGDVGGWLGDSTLVFKNYSPAKTIVFEPVAECRKMLLKTMKRNRISPESFDLQPFGLSNESGHFDDMEFRKLDDFQFDIPFGVLKADIEGYGLRFLQGAKKTIQRDRPLLSLSIYHNEDEFAGIYRTLKEWDIDYHCEIKSFAPLASHGEISLFAYPAEWSK